VDEIVVGAKLAIGAVTPYAVALRLAEIPQRLAQQYLRLLMPLASSVHSTAGEDDRLRSIFVTSTRLTVGIVFGAGLLLSMLAPQILTLWIGEEFRIYAGLVAVLVLALGLDLVQWPAGEILQGINRHRIFAVTALVTGGLNLGLSLLFVERFGLIGVAWGTAIPAALELGFVIWPFAIRTLGLPTARLLRDGLLPGLIAAIPSALVAALVLYSIPDAKVLFELLAAATLGGSTFVAVYLAMPPSMPERALLKTAVDSLAGRRPDA
ncbi:MAG: polysaccharide biosynthesis C-terminal domain-containing protein, partial [Thermoanaerobaculia bacterium]